MAHAIREAEEAARIERVEVEAQMSDESRLSPRLEALAENARGESWVASEAAHLAAFAAAAREEGRAEDPTDTSAWLLRKNAELEADVAMWRSSYEAAMRDIPRPKSRINPRQR